MAAPPHQRVTLDVLARHGALTIDDLAARTGTSIAGVRTSTRALVYRGLVEQSGGGDRTGQPHAFALTPAGIDAASVHPSA